MGEGPLLVRPTSDSPCYPVRTLADRPYLAAGEEAPGVSDDHEVAGIPASDEQPVLLLIDGYGLIFRAYYAIKNEIATSRGEVVNAVFGFASMLLDVLRREQPDYEIIAMESGTTLR